MLRGKILLRRKEHLKTFVADCIFKLLRRNYVVLEQFETSRKQNIDDRFEDWNQLYPDFYAVGPFGERPVHVCALLAARYRSEPSSGYIADGIAEGMKRFLDIEEYGRYAFESYGKHYSAAVGCWIARNKGTTKDLPFFDLIRQWYDSQLPETEAKARSARTPPSFHTWSTVCCGLFEGESVLFPFVASRDTETVAWLLRKDEAARDSRQEHVRCAFLPLDIHTVSPGRSPRPGHSGAAAMLPPNFLCASSAGPCKRVQ